MSPPFDTERNLNEGFENQDLGVTGLQEQEIESSADIESDDDFVEQEEAKEEASSTDLGSVQLYLHDIGSVPLLSREREIELAKEILSHEWT